LLKVKKRREGAPAPKKFLGHGIVDNFNKSFTFSSATSDAEKIGDEGWRLFQQMSIHPEDVRGIGIHIQQLIHEGGSPRKGMSYCLCDFETCDLQRCTTNSKANDVLQEL